MFHDFIPVSIATHTHTDVHIYALADTCLYNIPLVHRGKEERTPQFYFTELIEILTISLFKVKDTANKTMYEWMNERELRMKMNTGVSIIYCE